MCKAKFDFHISLLKSYVIADMTKFTCGLFTLHSGVANVEWQYGYLNVGVYSLLCFHFCAIWNAVILIFVRNVNGVISS